MASKPAENSVKEPKTAETRFDVHATFIMGADSFGIVSPMGIENIIKGFGAGDDPLNQRATSGWKAYFTFMAKCMP